MNEQKIKEIFSDKAYVESLLNMNSYEEVQKSLEEKGVDVSVDDLRKIRELLVKRVNGELSDKDLEEVAGGLGMGTVGLALLGLLGVGGVTTWRVLSC